MMNKGSVKIYTVEYSGLVINYCIYLNRHRSAYLIFRTTSAALIRGWHLFQHCSRQICFFLFLFNSTLSICSFSYGLNTDSKSRITREIHAEKETPEFHNNESENISSESIRGAVLVWGRRLLIFLFQMRHLL